MPGFRIQDMQCRQQEAKEDFLTNYGAGAIDAPKTVNSDAPVFRSPMHVY
jgi:hypothetical protein